MSLNRIVIMGRLTQTPELRSTQDGNFVINFCLAVERDFINKATNTREADFINCVAYGKTAEFVKKYFDKGNMVIASGRLQIRQWIDRNENKRYTAEVRTDSVYFGETKQKADPQNQDSTDLLETFKEIEDGELPF